ncbi:MAG: VTT domain-containing protein [Bacteroidales bacterium]
MRFFRITIITIIILVLGGFIFFTAANDPQQMLLGSLQYLESHLIYLVTVIFVLTLLSTLTGLPVLYLSVAIGFFIPYLPALALAWIIHLAAVIITFYMIRKVYSEYFSEKYGEKKVIRRINKRIKKYGFWTVALSRSVYFIPTNIINFSFPLSRITARQYLIGTMTGLVPECLINVTTGYLLKQQLQLLDAPQQNMLKIGLIGLFLLFMAALFLFLRFRKKRAEGLKLKKIVPLLEDE